MAIHAVTPYVGPVAMVSLTTEQIATLNDLMRERGIQEVQLAEIERQRVYCWFYDSDDGLVATATINDLGRVREFEVTGDAA